MGWAAPSYPIPLSHSLSFPLLATDKLWHNMCRLTHCAAHILLLLLFLFFVASFFCLHAHINFILNCARSKKCRTKTNKVPLSLSLLHAHCCDTAAALCTCVSLSRSDCMRRLLSAVQAGTVCGCSLPSVLSRMPTLSRWVCQLAYVCVCVSDLPK